MMAQKEVAFEFCVLDDIDLEQLSRGSPIAKELVALYNLVYETYFLVTKPSRLFRSSLYEISEMKKYSICLTLINSELTSLLNNFKKQSIQAVLDYWEQIKLRFYQLAAATIEIMLSSAEVCCLSRLNNIDVDNYCESCQNFSGSQFSPNEKRYLEELTERISKSIARVVAIANEIRVPLKPIDPKEYVKLTSKGGFDRRLQQVLIKS